MSTLTRHREQPPPANAPQPQKPIRTATAAEIGRLVANIDLDAARRHHVEMAAVVAELAHDADMDWPWTHDDPTVAVLRAFAKLALVAPHAVGPRAGALSESLATANVAGEGGRRREVRP